MSDTLSITVVIDAGKRRKIDVRGFFVYCRTSNQQEFQILTDRGSPISFFPGATLRPKGQFSRVTVVNNSATDELTVALVIGPEDFELSQFRIAAANRIETVADTVIPALTGPLVLAANLDRQRVIVSNPFGNTREIRVGDINVAADRGIEVFPGDSREMRTTAAIYAFNPDAYAQTISLTEFLE